MSGAFERIVAAARRIPRGRVVTYGQLAAIAGIPRGARIVGYAMRGGAELPWQRVLGLRRRGFAHITIRDPRSAAEQRRLLEREGVRFSARGDIDLAAFGWRPTSSSAGAPRSARRGARS